MSSDAAFTTSETLRSWAQDAEEHMRAPLEALAEQCERELAQASSERDILEPIAKELQYALNWFFPERGDGPVEPETFAVLKAVKVLSGALTAQQQALGERAHMLGKANDAVTRLTDENSSLKAKLADAVTALTEENSAIKAQLADARSALDVLHRALHGNLHEQTAVAPS